MAEALSPVEFVFVPMLCRTMLFAGRMELFGRRRTSPATRRLKARLSAYLSVAGLGTRLSRSDLIDALYFNSICRLP